MVETLLTKEQWQSYEKQGYLRLGKVLSEVELTALGQRIDEIMLGKADVDYDSLLMERAAGEGYEKSAPTLGFKGATLNYRKVQNLEYDPIFLKYIQKEIFHEIAGNIYGKDTRIVCNRIMFMNKPARHGEFLTFHQDRWTHLNRDPLVTVWTALDPATRENGCVQIFPGTHKHLINPSHVAGFLTPEQTEHLKSTSAPVFLELEPGEAVMLHNWTVHGSDGNTSNKSRRAISVCYMDANTVSDMGDQFVEIFQKDS